LGKSSSRKVLHLYKVLQIGAPFLIRGRIPMKIGLYLGACMAFILAFVAPAHAAPMLPGNYAVNGTLSDGGFDLSGTFSLNVYGFIEQSRHYHHGGVD
jgi:hypothetical protein